LVIRAALQLPVLRQRLVLPVIIVGIAGGAIGAAYVGTLHLLQQWLWPEGHGVGVQAAILVGTGLVVAVGLRLLGSAGGMELLVDNIHVLGGPEQVRHTRSLIPLSLLCVASGGAMGPEAPLVETTGTFGTWWARRYRLEPIDVRTLTITGMAAGFTVLFGAPLGAAVFALEILHRRGLEYYEALMPALAGSVCGYVIALLLQTVGIGPVWEFPAIGTLGASDMAWAALAGVLGGLAALAFTATATTGRRLMGRLPAGVRPVLGGIGLALLAWWSPYALTFGEVQAEAVIAGHLAAGALAVAVIAKFCGTLLTLVSGWKGGFIIPLFFMGACLGQLLHLAAPGANTAVVMAAFMVAMCVGVTKTPLGSTLVVSEMAGLTLLPTTILAALVAMVVTRRSGLIGSQRERDVIPVSSTATDPGFGPAPAT
jgi:H+/Cl- antiporter ClcA